MSISFEDALKAKKLRQFFNEKGRVYIVVDATSDDVNVPDFLLGDPALRLVLNTRAPQPIYIRDTFVESNFSFSGVAHHCIIPLNRIWAAYVPEQSMESGLVWEDSIPETVKMVLEAVEDIKDESEDGALKDQAEAAEQSSPKVQGRKVGHLRVVK